VQGKDKGKDVERAAGRRWSISRHDWVMVCIRSCWRTGQGRGLHVVREMGQQTPGSWFAGSLIIVTTLYCTPGHTAQHRSLLLSLCDRKRRGALSAVPPCNWTASSVHTPYLVLLTISNIRSRTRYLTLSIHHWARLLRGQELECGC
jgi:hypothetical protein